MGASQRFIVHPAAMPLHSRSLFAERAQLWFWLLVFIAAATLAIASVDPRVGLETYGGVQGQERVWQSVSRLRVFVALHCLFGSLILTVVAVIGLAACWRPARWFWLITLAGYFLYYRLDPRFVAAEWLYVLRGLCMLALGALSYYLVVGRRKESGAPGQFAWLQVALCICLLLGVAVGSLLTGGDLQALNKEMALSAMLFAAGLLAYAIWFGRESLLFSAEQLPGTYSAPRRTTIISSFILQCCLFMVLSFVFLQMPTGTRLLWAALSPLVTPIAGVYASYTWFLIEGPPQVFTGSFDLSTEIASEQARLYLGIFFQYLSIFCFSLMYFAIRSRKLSWTLAAHLVLLLYWLPAVWLMKQMTAVPIGA